MNLAFFLKILTDLCYYGMFAAFFASFYGLTGSILPQFALIALSAAVSRALWQKKPVARFLSLFLCLPAFLLPRSLLLQMRPFLQNLTSSERSRHRKYLTQQSN